MSAAAVTVRPPLWRRLVGFNLLTACVLGVGGWYVGWFAAHGVAGKSIAYFSSIDYNEVSIILAYICGVLGFLIGLGFLNYPLAPLRGHPPLLRGNESWGGAGYL